MYVKRRGKRNVNSSQQANANSGGQVVERTNGTLPTVGHTTDQQQTNRDRQQKKGTTEISYAEVARHG